MLTEKISVENGVCQRVQNIIINKTKQEKEWIELLSKYGSLQEFEKINNNSVSISMAIMKYRRILRNRDIGAILFSEINAAYLNNEYKKVHGLLEYMFLEPIAQNQFDFILNKINTKDDGMGRLHKEHLKNKNKRVLSIVLTL